MKDYKPL